MFFNQGLFNGQFEVSYIEEFAKLLGEKVSDVSILWKEKRSVASDPDMADSAQVLVGSSVVMGISSHKNKGSVNLKNIEGYEEIVYNALIDSRVINIDDRPSYSTGILCSLGHLGLLALVISGRPEVADFIWISLIALIASAGLMYLSLNGKWGSAARISISIISALAFVCLAPGSLLQMPLFMAINRSYIYNTAVKCYRGNRVIV